MGREKACGDEAGRPRLRSIVYNHGSSCIHATSPKHSTNAVSDNASDYLATQSPSADTEKTPARYYRFGPALLCIAIGIATIISGLLRCRVRRHLGMDSLESGEI